MEKENKLEKRLNSRYYKFLKRFLDLIFLNIIFCIVSILSLFVLLFPGLVALHSIVNKMINDQEYSVFKDYFKVIKDEWSFNWRIEVLSVSVVTIIGLVFYFDAAYIINKGNDWFVWFSIIFFIVLSLVLIAIFTHLMIFNNYFKDDTFRMMIKKSALIARKFHLSTFLNTIILICFVIVFYLFPYLVLFFPFSYYIYIVETISRKKYEQLKREEDEEALKEENLFLPSIINDEEK